MRKHYIMCKRILRNIPGISSIWVVNHFCASLPAHVHTIRDTLNAKQAPFASASCMWPRLMRMPSSKMSRASGVPSRWRIYCTGAWPPSWKHCRQSVSMPARSMAWRKHWTRCMQTGIYIVGGTDDIQVRCTAREVHYEHQHCHGLEALAESTQGLTMPKLHTTS